MSGDPAVEVSGLGKMYRIYDRPIDRLGQMLWGRYRRQGYGREFWALRDVSFAVGRGECVGIVGRNGSGKSTLLQMICGTLAPTTGSLRTNGRIAALLELGSGFNPEFSGRQNVYLNGSILGLSRQEIDERFDAIAAFADIGDFLDQPVKAYSSGMVVRLAFAVIVHVDADILIIDEALSVGDVFFVQKCMRVIRQFIETKTVLFVSHDTGAVLNLCSRAVLLEDSRMKLVGTAKAVAERYLQDLHEERAGNSEPAADPPVAPAAAMPPADLPYRDARADLVNASTLRNDLEVFRFAPDAAGFGVGLTRIEAVVLTDLQDRPLSWTVGGEPVALMIRCVALQAFSSPIIGFQLKDRLGQCLFGDNTYLSYRGSDPRVGTGGLIEARFEFRMPTLPLGDYTFTIAVASGSQESHVQHHWIHDALAIKSHASSAVQGLMGIPMNRITLAVHEPADNHE